MHGVTMGPTDYRGRLAPSPTGHLHLGHARTFWQAQERARAEGGALILRNEDLDPDRCRPAFVADYLEDLRWFGFQWSEGPDVGGAYGPYSQSERRSFYVAAFERLWAGGLIYPCSCSRRDVLQAAQAPHASDDEPLYPGTCREREELRDAAGPWRPVVSARPRNSSAPRFNWRLRIPDNLAVTFHDGGCGAQSFVAGRDFGDFVVWRHDDVPSYQLAVTVDDAAMQITEVVRGADLLVSTARQLLLYRALQLAAPEFHHCPLMTDDKGRRLAKRHAALSLRELRRAGRSPEELRAAWSRG
jgi:glutamyl-tRNA synthetase